jgi:hypothetical protein
MGDRINPIAHFYALNYSIVYALQNAIMKSNTTVKPVAQIRLRFRHGASREKLDEIFALFAPGAYLSAYSYAVVETNNDMTTFNVSYNPETTTYHDTMLDLTLVFSGLGLL